MPNRLLLLFVPIAVLTVVLSVVTVVQGQPSAQAPAEKLAFTVQPRDIAQGRILFAVQVEVQDASGNRVTRATNSITIAMGTNPSGTTVSGVATLNARNGVAIFGNLLVGFYAGGDLAHTLVATSPGLTSATSTNFSIPPFVAFIVQPSLTAPGAVISPPVQVELRDANGNRVSTVWSVSIKIGLNPGGGQLSGTTTVNTVNGVATFSDLSINSPGEGYSLMALAGTVGPGSARFDIGTRTLTPEGIPIPTPTPGPIPGATGCVDDTPQTDTPWPMHQHDRRRTGRSSFAGPKVPEEKWDFTTGRGHPNPDIFGFTLSSVYGFTSSLTLGSDGTIYAGARDWFPDRAPEGKLYAIKPNGRQKWTLPVSGSPAVADDRTRYGIFLEGLWTYPILKSSARGELYAGGAKKLSGIHKWILTVIGSPAVGHDGTLYFTSGGELYALNTDGSQKWKFPVSGLSLTVGSDGTIYVGSTDKKLYAIDPEGSLKETADMKLVISSPAIGADNTFYVSSGRELYAINPDGSQKWRFLTGRDIDSSPAIAADGTIYVAAGLVYAINADGTEKWELVVAGAVGTPAIGADCTIYVGSSGGYLYAINPDGTIKWRFLTQSGIHSGITVGADGLIYFGSADKNLYAVNPDGTRRWNWLTEWGVTSAPVIGANGTIYFTSAETLYALGQDPEFSSDLSVAWSEAPDSVIAGTNPAYELNVTNDGPMHAQDYRGRGVIITLPLPAGVSSVAATPTQGNCRKLAGNVECNLRELRRGRTATVTFQFTIARAMVGTITTTATVKGYDADLELTDNEATLNFEVMPPPTPTAVPTPTPTPVPSPTATPSPEATPTPSPEATPTLTPAPAPTPTSTPEPTPTPVPTATLSSTAKPEAVPTPAPTPTSEPTRRPTPTAATATLEPTAAATPVPPTEPPTSTVVAPAAEPVATSTPQPTPTPAATGGGGCSAPADGTGAVDGAWMLFGLLGLGIVLARRKG